MYEGLSCDDEPQGNDDFIPFRNIMNELYAKDILVKIKSSRVKLNDEAATIVRKLFARFLEGNTYPEIIT